MEEVGKVVKLEKGNAVVRVDKKDECSKCGMCLFPKNASFTEFNAENKVNAKVGDTVRIETAEKLKFLGIILVFLVPLVLIGISALITFLWIKNEIWVLILSLIFILIWFGVLSVIDKKLIKRKNLTTVIAEIIKEDENDDTGNNE